MIVYTNPAEIESLLKVPEGLLEAALRVHEVYPFRCTDHFFGLIREPSWRDPIFAQVYPRLNELEEGWDEDPYEEKNSTSHPRFVRRYRNRLLVLATNVCFAHCRFCMRKRLWRQPPFIFDDPDALRVYLESHSEVEDVLISGGDPFTLPSETLDLILSVVRSVPTVRILRIGTRALSVAPDAVMERIRVLEKHAPVWINAHFNHPIEITGECAAVVKALLKAGNPVNSQTVLLRGVNDSFEILKELFTKLLSVGVKPYYLFVGDPVKGTEHFYVPVARAVELIVRIRKELSGMAVPHLAVDSRYGKRIIP